MTRGLRLLVYDQTCTGAPWRPGLSHSWSLGSTLYRGLRRFDHSFPSRSWDEALAAVNAYEPDRPIAEIQYWGHGKWGKAKIDKDSLGAPSLHQGHRHHGPLRTLRKRLHTDSLWWFRTCETFGALPGQDFARAFTSFMGCRAAGHTFIIGPIQSGLHSLGPNGSPDWDPHEGLDQGTIEAPQSALWSNWKAPNTIHFLQANLPPNF